MIIKILPRSRHLTNLSNYIPHVLQAYYTNIIGVSLKNQKSDVPNCILPFINHSMQVYGGLLYP